MTKFVLSIAIQVTAFAHASECASGDSAEDVCSLLLQPTISQGGFVNSNVDQPMPDRAPRSDGSSQMSANSDMLAQARRITGGTGSIQKIVPLPWRGLCEEMLRSLEQASEDDLARICFAANLPDEACASALNGPLNAPRPWKQTQLMEACGGLEAAKDQRLGSGGADLHGVADTNDVAIKSRLIARATLSNPEDIAGDVSEDFNANARGAQGVDRFGAGIRGNAEDLEQSLTTKSNDGPLPVGSKIEGPFETGLANPVDQVMGWEEPEFNETEFEEQLAEDESWEDANWTAEWTDNASQGFYLPGGYAEASTWYVEENITVPPTLPEEPVAEETPVEENHGPEAWELGYDEYDDALVNSSIDFGDSGPTNAEDSPAETPSEATNNDAPEGEEVVVDDGDTVDSSAEDSSGVDESPAADSTSTGDAEESVPNDTSEGTDADDSEGDESTAADSTPTGDADESVPNDTSEGTDADDSEGEVEIPGDSVILEPPR